MLAEVLGALQRMGLNPPPAILVKPEDALSSVRSAILLGAVVPELRRRPRSCSPISTNCRASRPRSRRSDSGWRRPSPSRLGEKQRLGLLLAEKQRLQGEREAALAASKKRSAELAAKAGSLKDLIASLEKDMSGRVAEEKARRAEEERAQARSRALAAMPVPEANRLVETPPFSALQGQVALPVTGRIKRRFGDDDGNGGVMLGDMVATQSGAIVTAPADGSVLYAGPFRSYGQLLILNAGDGYHVVLAGMGQNQRRAGSVRLGGRAGRRDGGGQGGEHLGDRRLEMPRRNSMLSSARMENPSIRPHGGRTRLSGRTGNGT